MVSVAAKEFKAGAFFKLILSELKPRLHHDVWKSTAEFLEVNCNGDDEQTADDASTLLEDCDEAKSWLKWANSRSDIKIVTASVPDGILPPGFSGKLHDAKVFSRGPDDVLYDRSKELRMKQGEIQRVIYALKKFTGGLGDDDDRDKGDDFTWKMYFTKVARGNCFLELTTPSETVTFCVIYALKKFTGGLGDDDDRDKGDDFTWKMYFTKPLDDCRYVVCTSKANGEAAHLSALSIGDQYYLCAGSKNVHMIFRNRDDVDKYDPKSMRYSIAREICVAVLKMLDALTPERRNCLIEFLAKTRLTAVFEILNPDHPHVEDLSSLSSPQMKFITWTSLNLSPASDESLACWLAPDVSLEIARVLGLDTVDYTVIEITEVDDRMIKIRRYHNLEGEVLFFMDGERNVIGMLKKKSVWYILVRAIREKVRSSFRSYTKEGYKFQLENENKRIEKRIDEIQKWLGLDDATVASWKSLGIDFLKWSLEGAKSNKLHLEDVITRFPVFWKKFLEEHERSDKIFVSNCISG